MKTSFVRYFFLMYRDYYGYHGHYYDARASRRYFFEVLRLIYSLLWLLCLCFDAGNDSDQAVALPTGYKRTAFEGLQRFFYLYFPT